MGAGRKAGGRRTRSVMGGGQTLGPSKRFEFSGGCKCRCAAARAVSMVAARAAGEPCQQHAHSPAAANWRREAAGQNAIHAAAAPPPRLAAPPRLQLTTMDSPFFTLSPGDLSQLTILPAAPVHWGGQRRWRPQDRPQPTLCPAGMPAGSESMLAAWEGGGSLRRPPRSRFRALLTAGHGR